MGWASVSQRLTAVEIPVFQEVYEYVREHGRWLQFRQIAGPRNWSQGKVVQVFRALVEAGYLIHPSPHEPTHWALLKRPDGSPFSGFADIGLVGGPQDDLDEKNFAVFAKLYNDTRDHGYQPTQREMMATIGIIGNNCSYFRKLEELGYVALDSVETRSIKILKRPDGTPFRGFEDKP